MIEDKDFVRIRIRKSDHARITKRVTHEIKIYEVITKALDALDKVKKA